jgi:hypothetical protein
LTDTEGRLSQFEGHFCKTSEKKQKNRKKLRNRLRELRALILPFFGQMGPNLGQKNSVLATSKFLPSQTFPLL